MSDDSIAAYQAVIDRYPRTVFAQEARRVLGMALLPAWQIEPPPEVRAESIKLQAMRDSAVVQQARADSLARVAQVSQADTLKSQPPEPPEPPTSARGERGRDRRSGRERVPGPSTPEPLAPGRISPASPDSVRKPMVGPAIGESLPPKPTPRPETLAKPGPLPPEPDTGKVSVRLPPEPVRPETAQKPAPVAPKPETALKSEKTTPALQKEEPVVGERFATRGISFFPDTGMGAVFFGYDSTRIRDEDTAMLRANVEYLKNHPELKLMLVGWCDSSGAPPYNLALGLRRAQAVLRWLVKYGIDAARISVHSNGSEWADETEPDSMWQDRRCEFWTRTR
jgi:outer membrane protein OmpA-like peptidoglycan-associated protein